ncbi:MAG: PEP-CTERM sorting domain-containing protein [Phycisphaerae bacterium]|nr:PEP-CTERM sorting domain-containing protein [Phycisphaerae bacterium]
MTRSTIDTLYRALALLSVLVLATPALGGATGQAYNCSLSGEVTAADDMVVWNTANPEDWLVHAEAEVYHACPPLYHDYGVDTEEWAPAGDGHVQTAATVPSASATNIEASAAGGGFTKVGSVQSSAHDIPASWSAAAGLAQYDNLFWIVYAGGGSPPPGPTSVNVAVTGDWYLQGNSDPDDNWSADVTLYAEVYDEDGDILAFQREYHRLDGPGPKSKSGQVNFLFDVDLEYDTAYALRYYIDAESYAVAVPEPATLTLLLTSGVLLARRRRC